MVRSLRLHFALNFDSGLASVEFSCCFCCRGSRVQVRIAPSLHAPPRLQQDDRGRAKKVDKQHNSTRLHCILDSGRLDDLKTVWTVPAGITTSGCKAGTRIRRSTDDRQRRCEGKGSEDWDRSLAGATVSRLLLSDDEGHECDGDTGRSVSQLETDGLSASRGSGCR